MRLLKKLVIKLITMAIMVAVVGALFRCAKPYIMKSAGIPEGMPGVEGLESAKFSSEESDLMGTVFKSAVRLFTGQAKRDELASELSDKLYAGRADSGMMSELGIELEKPGGKPAVPSVPGEFPKSGPDPAAPAGANIVNAQPGAQLRKTPGAPNATAKAPVKNASDAVRDALLGRLLEKAKANPELALVPIVIFGMLAVHLFRRRRTPEDDFMLPDLSKLLPSEAETYEMTHQVHALPAEDFELLVALIYQRQGYRITMPAGRGSGRGGDFTAQRKSERLLVQCKKANPDHKVHVDRVRELHEAAVAAGVTRGVYVTTCGFSWDARNLAKVKGVTPINARMLDCLLNEARQKPDEDFLKVWEWAPKLLSKIKMTPPLCPACEAPMDEINNGSGSVWVCSQRPDCRGRRSARKDHQALQAASVNVNVNVSASAKPQTTSEAAPAPPPPEILGGRARTICPSDPSTVKPKPAPPPAPEKWLRPEGAARRPRTIFSPTSSAR